MGSVGVELLRSDCLLECLLLAVGVAARVGMEVEGDDKGRGGEGEVAEGLSTFRADWSLRIRVNLGLLGEESGLVPLLGLVLL